MGMNEGLGAVFVGVGLSDASEGSVVEDNVRVILTKKIKRIFILNQICFTCAQIQNFDLEFQDFDFLVYNLSLF